MAIEIICLVVMSLFFIVAWLPASYGKLKTFGPKWVSSNRTPIPNKNLEGWAARSDRAHQNLKEFFPALIAAVIILGLTNKFSHATSVVSIIYVTARIAHFISYTLGNVIARAIFFFAGLLSNIFLLIYPFI